MTIIDPFEFEPREAQHEFANFQDEIYRQIHSEMWEIQHELGYILWHSHHPENFGDVDNEVYLFLKENGLKQSKPIKNNEKANPDYYLAMYWGLEVTERFFKNYRDWDFDIQLSNLLYAKQQLSIVEALSSTNAPKHKSKDTKGQSKGATTRNQNVYRFSRQKAIIEWEKYKKNLPEWRGFKQDFETHMSDIDKVLKEFEQKFCNLLSFYKYKGATTDVTALLEEKYTDSTANPPLAIAWIKEHENIRNIQDENAKKKRKEREFKNSVYAPLDIQLNRQRNNSR